jgi:hypothetical protein
MSQQELPPVALPTQEKINFKTAKLFTSIWGKKNVDLLICSFVYAMQPINQINK